MSESRELPDKLTHLSVPGLWEALLLRWETLGVPVLRRAIELKLAHIHLETGLRSCHNYNLGNVKSVIGDGRCWQYFACGEEIDAAKLNQVQAQGPGLVIVKARYQKGGAPWVSVRILPRHPWSRFAAFETLSEGVELQLAYLRRHPAVLAALQTGEPRAYNDALLAARYYTAGGAGYLRTLEQRLAIVRSACIALDWGDVT
jgi:hypothetical protein